jgi:hypothetical protein
VEVAVTVAGCVTVDVRVTVEAGTVVVTVEPDSVFVTVTVDAGTVVVTVEAGAVVVTVEPDSVVVTVTVETGTLLLVGTLDQEWGGIEVPVDPLPPAEAAGEPKIIKNTPCAAAITPATSRMNRPVLLVMRSPPSKRRWPTRPTRRGDTSTTRRQQRHATSVRIIRHSIGVNGVGRSSTKKDYVP